LTRSRRLPRFADRSAQAWQRAFRCRRWQGSNVTERGQRHAWYAGPTLLDHLETVDITSAETAKPARMPVQWVCRQTSTFRGFAGTLASGTLKPGDAVKVLPSARQPASQRHRHHGWRP
jgi:bifunctional enzyme CysN/CysC